MVLPTPLTNQVGRMPFQEKVLFAALLRPTPSLVRGTFFSTGPLSRVEWGGGGGVECGGQGSKLPTSHTLLFRLPPPYNWLLLISAFSIVVLPATLGIPLPAVFPLVVHYPSLFSYGFPPPSPIPLHSKREEKEVWDRPRFEIWKSRPPSDQAVSCNLERTQGPTINRYLSHFTLLQQLNVPAPNTLMRSHVFEYFKSQLKLRISIIIKTLWKWVGKKPSQQLFLELRLLAFR